MIQIKNKYDCCGCSACIRICPKKCISLKEDNEGFLYPSVNSSDCINCHFCERICPIINVSSPPKEICVYAMMNSDEQIRMESSSGGIFTLLAQKIIKEGGVVFGAKFNEKWEVIHGFTETIDGLSKFRGSKYVQSEMGNCFDEAKKFLNEGRKVLFSGTPCQIAGLLSYLKKRYDTLLTVDFVCHGVPSPRVWKLYLNAICKKTFHRVKTTEISTINFRSKNTSWRNFSFLAVQKGGRLLLNEQHRKNAYMQGFLNNLYLRPSCHECKFKRFQSQSDLTLADFWGVEKYYPEMNDDKGISLVFTSNSYLKKLLLSEGAKEISMRQAVDQNPAIFRSVKMRRNRSLFFFDLNQGKDLLKSIEKRARWDRRESIRFALIKFLEKLHLLNFIKLVINGKNRYSNTTYQN